MRAIIYTIEQTDYGVRLTFSGKVTAEEFSTWLDESRLLLPTIKDDFCVFVDMRSIIPIGVEEGEVISKGQTFYRKSGMLRSVVILSNPVITMQFKQIAHETNIYKYERYIDSSHISNWEQIGLDWLIKQIDPDINITNPLELL